MKSEVTPDILKRIIDKLESHRINYLVIAGFGLDGRRGFLTRSHQDIDILCLKEDIKEIERIIQELGYSGEKHNNMYKVYGEDSGKIDFGMLEIEGNEAVSYGRIAITRFPKELFEKPQKGKINDIEFNIAPNELLKIWGESSGQKQDSEYVKSIKVDEEVMKKIKRELR